MLEPIDPSRGDAGGESNAVVSLGRRTELVTGEEIQEDIDAQVDGDSEAV